MTVSTGSPTRRRFLVGSSVVAAAAVLAVAAEGTALATTVPIYDVTAYGAVGDGTTDDRSAIQAAINAGALTAAGAPFAIYFPIPSPAYALGSALTVPDGCVLVGERGSRSKLLVLATSLGSAIVNATASGNKGLVVRNLEIDGNKGARPLATAALIKLAATGGTVSRVTITDCWLHHAPAGGIALESAANVAINHNEFSDNTGTSISARLGLIDGRILGNFLHDNAGDHLSVDVGTDLLISDNLLRTQSAGIGITLKGVTRAEVVGNLLDQPSITGVLLSNSAATPSIDVAISQNSISGVGAVAPGGSAPVGIDLQSGSGGTGNLVNVRVERNKVTSASGAGIRAQSLSAAGSLVDLAIATNHIQCTGAPSGSKGISVTGASITDPVLASNNVVGAPGGGIVLGSAAATVVRPTIRGNRVRDCAGIALRVVGASAPMISGNRAVTTGSVVQTHGLSLESPTGVINEYGNDFSTSTIADVAYVGAGAQKARLGLGQCAVYSGTGDPNAALPAAPVGSLFLRTDGPSATTTLWVRESTAALTGWVAK